MGFIPIVDANGNHIQDANGNDIWVLYDGPSPGRVVEVSPQNRAIEVSPEDRTMRVASGS